jgi:prepilin-type N-terminal cleavage/methylation domain-containing protein
VIHNWFEKHRELVRQRDEEGFDGFTLIELLIVIVVLGILAATVIFALGGVTGQSAQAACNSDAKTTEVAIQAYIASPDNTTNTPPTTMAELYTAPFNATGNPLVTGNGDTFETAQNNTAYTVTLGTAAQVTDAAAKTSPAGAVIVTPKGKAAGWYDDPNDPTTNPCSNVT